MRLDAATRYLRSRGHKVLLTSGVDPYESYVNRHAEIEDISPHKLAQKYTLEIQNDLAAFNIDYDIWHDPLLYPGRETYERHCQEMLQRLMSLDTANYNTRNIPYSTIRKQFVPRSFLIGKCPSCQSEVAGCICEGCGRQFIAEEVIEPQLLPHKKELSSKLLSKELEWPEVEVLELSLHENDARIQNIVDDVKSLSIPSRHTDMILSHIHNQKCHVELTVPGDWGIPWQSKEGPEQIIFNYCTYYPFFLTVGDFFAAAGTGKNAFAVDSNIITISTYGSDTPVPWIGVPIILSHLDVDADGKRQYRGYDHYWGNEFLCLHGAKFSTSRRHVIWAGELIEQTPVTVDMARYYLATIDPAQKQTNFLIDDLVSTINQIVIDEIYHTVDVCLQEYIPHDIQAASPNMTKAVNKAFAEQDSCFDASQFYLEKAANLISNWIETWHRLTNKNPSDSYWFLKSLAMISYPIMPNLGETLWHHLGATGKPNLAEFDNRTPIQTSHFQTKVQHINQADISPCLPTTLNHLMNNELSLAKDNKDSTTEETNHV